MRKFRPLSSVITSTCSKRKKTHAGHGAGACGSSPTWQRLCSHREAHKLTLMSCLLMATTSTKKPYGRARAPSTTDRFEETTERQVHKAKYKGCEKHSPPAHLCTGVSKARHDIHTPSLSSSFPWPPRPGTHTMVCVGGHVHSDLPVHSITLPTCLFLCS
jgi:hypothetical protein